MFDVQHPPQRIAQQPPSSDMTERASWFVQILENFKLVIQSVESSPVSLLAGDSE